MTDKQDLIREIHEYVAAHGGENTATHLLVQAASAIQTQAAELEAVGAGGVSGPLLGRAAPPTAQAEGWRLVPVEPTNGMQIAADTWIAKGFNWPKAIYRAMLAASPTPPAEKPIGEVVVTKTRDGQIVSVTRQDDEGRILSVIATSDPEEQSQPRYSHLHDADAVHGKQLSVYSKPPAEQQAAPKAAPGEPPGIRALMCVISSLRDTAHFSDEEGELTNDLRTLRDWAYAQTAAFQPSPTAQGATIASESGTPPAEQQATKETSGGFHVWRDISTAPKDGSRFVATGHNYGLYSEGRHACVAQWFRGSWIEASEWNEASELTYLTHWMPLPSPPDDVAAPAEQQAAPRAAPGGQTTVPAEWLEQAYREGWAACRDAETIGEEAEDWAFGNSTANSRMIDAQQAAPKAAPGEPSYSEKWDAELGRAAMRFVDRAGDVHPGIDDAETICAEFHKAMSEVIERMPHVQRMAAPQQEAQEPCQTCIAMARTVMMDQASFDRKPDCYGIRQITDDDGIEEWEDIRTSPDVAREEANDMMATGRGEIYEVVPLWTTPQPAPAPLTRDQIREVFMAHGFTIKEGQTDLKQYVYDAAYALLELVAAPQQEAQEPALFVSAKQLADLVDPSHATGGSYLPARKTRAGLFTQPLYTAPQTAPDCHHRPPCNECAAIAAQGGKE